MGSLCSCQNSLGSCRWSALSEASAVTSNVRSARCTLRGFGVRTFHTEFDLALAQSTYIARSPRHCRSGPRTPNLKTLKVSLIEPL